jgi:hypothetical protein
MTVNMDVADPQDFVSDANKAANQLVVAQSIAVLVNVQESAVSVVLSLGTRSNRRLAAAALRRLTTNTTYVIATSEITVADEAAANIVKTAADAVSPTDMTTQVKAQLVASGYTQAQVDALGLNVTSAAAVVVLPGTTNGTATNATNATANNVGTGTAAGAIKTSFSIAPLFAVCAWVFSNV